MVEKYVYALKSENFHHPHDKRMIHSCIQKSANQN